jgi:peptidoglycan/xylan/chitin deacetylase (PgdA/CDA1 family)
MKPTVLMYHGLLASQNRYKYEIELGQFDKQLNYLFLNGYKCIVADDFNNSLSSSTTPSSGKTILITFDDGHESDYNCALPILKKYSFKATFFVTTDWIGKSEYMSAAQLRELVKEGMSVQSHAKTHSFLDALDIPSVNIELKQSKQELENILGKEVRFISLPGGRYNYDTIKCAKVQDYAAMFCSKPFYYRNYGNFPLIGRFGVKQNLDFRGFEQIINNDALIRWRVKSQYDAKFFAKKILGNKVYYALWKRYIIK